jgi:hypothetical protein
MKTPKKPKPKRRNKAITDAAVLRSLDAVDELMLWAGKLKKSLERAKKSLGRAKERHLKVLEQAANLAKDTTRDPDNIKWIVEPSSINAMIRMLERVSKDVDEMVTVTNNRWSEEAEVKRALASKKAEAERAVLDTTYKDDVPF